MYGGSFSNKPNLKEFEKMIDECCAEEEPMGVGGDNVSAVLIETKLPEAKSAYSSSANSSAGRPG